MKRRQFSPIPRNRFWLPGARSLFLAAFAPGVWQKDFVTAQAGNFSDGNTWIGGYAPQPGEARSVTINHAVTGDVNFDIGMSGQVDQMTALLVNDPGSFTISDGITGYIRGEVYQNNAPITIGAGCTILQSSAKATNGATVSYKWQISTAHGQTGAHLTINGTTGAHTVFGSDGIGGPSFIEDGAFLRGGLITSTFTDFQYIDYIHFWPSGSLDTFSHTDFTARNCGEWKNTGDFEQGAQVLFRRGRWFNTTSAYTLRLNTARDKAAWGLREIDSCVIDRAFDHNAGNFVIHDTVFCGGMSVANNADATNATFYNNYMYRGPAAVFDYTMPWGDYTDTYICNEVDNNPHLANAHARSGGTATRMIFEAPLSFGNGDAYIIPNSDNAGQHYGLEYSILLANYDRKGVGAIYAMNGGANSAGHMQHCSFATDNLTGETGMSVGETYAGRAGMITKVKDNLAIGTVAGSPGFVLQRIDTGGVQDIVAAANVTNNGKDNLATGTDGVGYNAVNSPNFFSTGTPGSGDVVGSANLVDPWTGVAKWDMSLAPTVSQSITGITRTGSIATATTAVAHGRSVGDWVTIAGANETAYNGAARITAVTSTTFDFVVAGSPATPATGTITITKVGSVSNANTQFQNGTSGYTVAALIAYVFAAWAPTNAAFQGTASDSTDIGAVPVLSSGTSANPGAGSLVYTGFAPTVNITRSALPGTGALAYTGFAPTVNITRSALPGTGALAYTGFAPTVTLTDNKIASPGVGSLAYTGFVPTVNVSQSALPGTGALAYTGFAPTVNISRSALPGTGALAYNGFAPVANSTRSALPGTGALTYTGFAPTVNISQSALLGTGQLAYNGFAPTVNISRSALPGTGALTYTGFAPTVTISGNQVATPGTGALTYTGFAPTVNITTSALPGTGALVYTGYAPTVTAGGNNSATPGTGQLSYTGYAPTVNITVNASPGTGTLVYSGFAPVVNITRSARPGTGGLIYTGFAPTVSIPGSEDAAISFGGQVYPSDGYY